MNRITIFTYSIITRPEKQEKGGTVDLKVTIKVASPKPLEIETRIPFFRISSLHSVMASQL